MTAMITPTPPTAAPAITPSGGGEVGLGQKESSVDWSLISHCGSKFSLLD